MPIQGFYFADGENGSDSGTTKFSHRPNENAEIGARHARTVLAKLPKEWPIVGDHGPFKFSDEPLSSGWRILANRATHNCPVLTASDPIA